MEVIELFGESAQPGAPDASGAQFGSKPGYTIHGRALTIGLTPNICDAYSEFQGELTDTGFVGRFVSTGLGNYEDLGQVFGVMIDRE